MRKKAKVDAGGGRGIQGKETALGASQVPILPQGPLPGLPSHQAPCHVADHRTSSCSPQLGSKTSGRLA